MGETITSPENEQISEEGGETEGSDESNETPVTDSDQNDNEDSVDADNDNSTDVDDEDSVEEPTEEEIVDSTITDPETPAEEELVESEDPEEAVDATKAITAKVVITSGDGFTSAITGGTIDPDNTITGITDLTFTIEANEGYVVKSVKWAIDNTEKDEITPESDGSYKIAKTELTEDALQNVSIVTITVETAQLFDVTVTVDTPDNLETLQAIIDSGSPETIDNGKVSVEKGATLSLKVVPKTGYTVASVTVGGQEKAVGSDNTYVIGAIAEAIEVSITTEAEAADSYEVTESIQENGSPASDAAKVADIVYEDECVDEEADPKTIAKDTSLKFKVNEIPGDGQDAEGSFVNKVVEVSYKIAGGEAQVLSKNAAKDPANTVYEVSSDKITGNVEIIVNVRDLAEVTVDFTGVDPVKVNLKYGKDDEAADTFALYRDGDTVKAAEGSTFKFTVDPLGVYQCDGVTVAYGDGDPEEKTAVGGVYSFEVTNETPKIVVKTSYNKNSVNSIAFKVTGDAGSYTVDPANITDEEDTKLDDIDVPEAGYFTAGDTVLTLAENVKVTLTANESYDIKKVELGTDVLYDAADEKYKDAEAAGPYLIAFPTDGTVAAKDLTVTTEVKTLEDDIDVTFEKGRKNPTEVAYTVTVGDTIVKKNGAADSYTIKAGEGYLKFDVTTLGKYTPVVEVNGELLENPTPVSGKYSYSYLVARLNGKDDGANTIVVDAEVAKKTVTVNYKSEEVVVSAAVGNTEQALVGNVYTVNDGTKLSFKVAARDHYQISKVTTKVGNAEAVDVTLTNGKFDLQVEEDTIVTITAAGVSSQKTLTDVATGEEPAKDKKGNYIVSNTGTYEGGAVEGSKDVTIKKVALLSGSAEIPATEGEGEAAVTNWSANASKTQITLFPTAKIAGKTLTLRMYGDKAVTVSGNSTSTEDVVAEYKLAVSTSLDASKVKVADIKQATDTEGEYSITVNAGAEVDKIYVDTADAGLDKDIVKQAVIEDGKLKVTTGFKAGETSLKLYMAKDASKEPTGDNRVEKVVKVTTTALLDKDVTNAPAVKAVSSTDVSITLSLDAKKLKLPDPVAGSLYYEVVAKANGDVPKDKDGKALLKTEVIQYVAKVGDIQNAVIRFDVSGSEDIIDAYGTGGYCKYDITVKLVHLKDKTDKSGQTTLIADADLAGYSKSFSTGTKPFETKNPYYENSLKLKKGTTTIYTGQYAVAATAQFSKNTSYMVLDESTARDTTAGLLSYEKLNVDVDRDTNEVWVHASSRTKLGKHTIEVMAMTTDEDTMYASRATIAVTVVRGIEELQISVPADRIYKAPDTKTAATVTPTVIYNNGATAKDMVPKTKKVGWVLMSADGSEELQEANPALYSKLSLNSKNGKVTVAKDYVVSPVKANNQFSIKAYAMDYKVNGTDFEANKDEYDGGTTATTDPITITNDAMEIGSLAILDRDNKVLARGTATLEASEVQGAKLVAFIPGAPEKAVYSNTDITNYVVTATNVKFTSSNKAVIIGTDGTISVTKPAKNVTLTAAAGDGSTGANAKKTMKLTVNYDTTGELGLYFEKYNTEGGYYGDEFTSGPDNLNPTFTDSTAAMFLLTVQQKGDNGWDDVSSSDFTNYSVTIKGGKILSKQGDTVEIATASAVTTITLKNNNVKPAVSKTYTLTNAGISTLAKGIKAPKVTIKDTLKAGVYSAQRVKVQLANSVKADKPGYIEDFSKLYVKADFDWTSLNVKKPEAQEDFAEQMNPKGYFRVSEDGSFQLSFYNNAWEDGTNLTAGSYKVKLNFGEIDEDGNFKSVTPAAAVTLKVVKPKALSFKPTTSYKISALDSSFVVLTGKGNYDDISFYKLQNANVNGQPNKFITYFELGEYVYDDDDNCVGRKIKFTDAYFDEVDKNGLNLADKANKNDLTGYVTYTAENYNGESVTNTVKITMNVTAPTASITKYTISSGVISSSAGAKVRLYVTDNKKQAVPVIAANFGEANTWTAERLVYGSEADPISTNIIQLTAKSGLTAKQKYQIPIVILPESSYYAAAYESATDKVAFVNKYGISLTATVTANDLATVNKGRITADSKQLSKTFSAYQFDGAAGDYVVYVPFNEVYTETVINKITNNSVQVGSGESAPQLINIQRDGDSNYFKITMNKALFEQAIKADVKANGKEKYTFYDSKGKAKTLSVKADVCYNAEGTQKDSFTFKLTMPATRSSYTATADMSAYEQAVDALNKDKMTIAASVKVAYYWDDESNDYTCDTIAAQWDLLEAIIGKVGADSGIDFGFYEIDDMLKVGTLDEPTSTENGKLPITAYLKNVPAEGAAATTNVITFNLPITKLETRPSEVKSGVDAFLLENSEKYAVNTTTEEQMRTDLRTYMAKWAAEQEPVINLTPIRFRIEGFEVEPAGFVNGSPKAGSVTGTVIIWNIHGNGAEAEVKIDYTIKAPLEEADVIDTVKKAVGVSGDNASDVIAQLVIANDEDAVKADILAVANKAAGYPYTVTYKDDSSFAFKEVGAKADGSISFTLVVKNGDKFIGTKAEDGSITPTEITLPETALPANEGIITVADAATKVQAWVTKVNAADATDEDRAFLTNVKEESIVTEVKAKAELEDKTLSVTVEGFAKEDADIDADGSVKGTIVLSKGGEINKKEAKIAFNFTLAKTDAWTLDEAENRIQAAVEDADIYISNTNVKTDAGKAARAAEILEIAKAAVPADKYDVAIAQEGADDAKTDVKLVVTEAKAGVDGKVTLSLVISDKDPDAATKSKTITVEHAIPALEAGAEDPKPDVTAAAIAADIEKISTAAVETADVTTDEETQEKTIGSDTAKAAIEKVISEGSYSWKSESYTLTVVLVTDIKEADTNAGSATVNFTVELNGETSEGTLTLVINPTTPPEDEVRAADIAEDIAKITTAAVEATDIKDNAIDNTTAKNAIDKVISEGNYSWKSESYTLTVVSVTNITEPDENNGSALVTFTVELSGQTSDQKTLTLVINKAE